MSDKTIFLKEGGIAVTEGEKGQENKKWKQYFCYPYNKEEFWSSIFTSYFN